MLSRAHIRLRNRKLEVLRNVRFSNNYVEHANNSFVGYYRSVLIVIHEEYIESFLIQAQGVRHAFERLKATKENPPSALNLQLVRFIAKELGYSYGSRGPYDPSMTDELYEFSIEWKHLETWKLAVSIYLKNSASVPLPTDKFARAVETFDFADLLKTYAVSLRPKKCIAHT